MKKFKSSVTSKLTKVTSMILVALMTVSLAGCGGQTAQKDNRMTTEDLSTESKVDVDVDEPITEIDPGVDVTETTTEEPTTEEPTTEATTEAPGDNSGVDNGDGTWSYTVYGDIVVTLPVNIDDYIKINDRGCPGLLLAKLAKSFGWTLPYYDSESNPCFYQYDCGDFCICFTYDYYNGDTIDFYDYEATQIKRCHYFFTLPNDSTTSYYDDSYTMKHPEYQDVIATFAQKPDKLEYLIYPGRSFAISRDDAIIIVYLLTFVKYHPGENPLYYLGGSIADYREGVTSSDSYLFP